MTNKLRTSAAIALWLCVATVGSAQQPGRSYQPKVGQLHPDFVLPNIETGEPVSLSQHRGKKVLLIHFASW